MNSKLFRSYVRALSETQTRAYLIATGWIDDGDVANLATIWHRPSAEQSNSELLLPRERVARDYEDRVADLLLSHQNKTGMRQLRGVSNMFCFEEVTHHLRLLLSPVQMRAHRAF